MARTDGDARPLGEVGRRGEAAEFALDQPGERDRRAVFQVVADDLHPDRQPTVAAADRRYRRRQAVQGGDARPGHLIEVGDLGAVDLELPAVPWRMVVREGEGWHRRAQAGNDLLKTVE